MINIQKLIAIATVGATVLGVSSMASAQRVVWHGPIFRPICRPVHGPICRPIRRPIYSPIHIVYNPVRYAPVPIPVGVYEPAPLVVASFGCRRPGFFPPAHYRPGFFPPAHWGCRLHRK